MNETNLRKLFEARVEETQELGLHVARRRVTEGGIHGLEPEDVYQEVLLSMWGAYGDNATLLGNAAWFTNTLVSAIGRRVIDVWRSQNSDGVWKGVMSLDSHVNSQGEAGSLYHLLQQGETPDAAVARAEHAQQVSGVVIHVLQNESPERRDIFMRRYVEGAPVKSIAEALGRPVGTIGTALHTLRGKMQEHLERKGLIPTEY